MIAEAGSSIPHQHMNPVVREQLDAQQQPTNIPAPPQHNDCDPVRREHTLPNESVNQWHGFKIVGDNLDKNIKPRHQTLLHKTQSLHYFNVYAIKDRVDLSQLSDVPPTVDIEAITMDTVLPTPEDLDQLLTNFAVLAGRILVAYIPVFATIPSLAKDHIQHCFSRQMSEQSKVVRDLAIMLIFSGCIPFHVYYTRPCNAYR